MTIIDILSNDVKCFLTNHSLKLETLSTKKLVGVYKKLPKYSSDHTELIIRTLVSNELLKRKIVFISSNN